MTKSDHKETQAITMARELLRHAEEEPLSFEKRQSETVKLVAYILEDAISNITSKELKLQKELAKMMADPIGKVFTTAMTDQCFRSRNHKRVANQLIYLLRHYGVPKFLSKKKQLQLYLFQLLGQKFSMLFVPIATFFLRKQTAAVIIPGEKRALIKHIKKRQKEGVRLNLNHLGEAILGEAEAKRRLEVYLKDLKHPLINYVSIKISTIFSQINLLAPDQTLEVLAKRLRQLYRAAMKPSTHKFVNLDMEEHRDLHLTKDLFIKVLDEPEFLELSAGIVLQAYLPDSHDIQRELTLWAKARIQRGGAPIKIRIVKGANMAMEQVESSLHDWAQPPYQAKKETDANYKRMVLYGAHPEHAKAVHIGVASHNLFDIAFALILRAEHRLEKEMTFEMLEGMSDHMRRSLQKLTGDILLYCAVATKKDFQSAIAYLIRRLDENTGAENFLASSFELEPHSKEWERQVEFFHQACLVTSTTDHTPRNKQDRNIAPIDLPLDAPFENASDTNFALPQNLSYAQNIITKWKNRKISPIPLVIDGKEIHHTPPTGKGHDPSNPTAIYYSYTQGSWEEINRALDVSKKYESAWGKTSIEERSTLISECCKRLRKERGNLTGVMVADGGKQITEADVEISEAIDFGEYYLRSMEELSKVRDLEWTPKGTILVTPPWNFPVAIPVGGIFAALATGNCVIFKPAAESILAGWQLVNILWDAGIPKQALQFIACEDDPVGSKLVKDSRINAVILTGATSTARLFLTMRPDLDLSAETGGKNSMIITSLADRDLAIKSLVQSAFGHNGQKCSAASLAIVEKEVYDDPRFRQQLKDATKSLKVGSAWDPANKITPLIRPPSHDLKKALTTNEPGESWLIEPKVDPSNANLWSPGIKWDVKPNSFTHQTELFGPVLSVIRAENLDDAIHIANSTPYGLTAGIQTLDKREQKRWEKHIIAGNCYVNRTTTGAVVRRQPFGGCKASCIGHGSKAGGPNYLMQFMHVKQTGVPKEKFPPKASINNLTSLIEKYDLSTEELGIWYASIANYAFFAKQMSRSIDVSKVVGQDNFLRYVPNKGMALRIEKGDAPIDYLRILTAALTCKTPLEVSMAKNVRLKDVDWEALFPAFTFIEEESDQFIERVRLGQMKKVRLLKTPSKELFEAASRTLCYLNSQPVLANGRVELTHYMREISLSTDYHRYGNLGLREGELRKPIL